MNRTLTATTIGLALVLALGPGSPVHGQEGGAEEKKTFAPEQIEQLVAPIALHPDDLVSQILMASTYPLEVVEATRWVKANKSLKGDSLANALKSKSWDPSVKSLVNFPDVLDMMDKKLDWTQNLGNAFLADKKAVMDAIQKLRKKAMDEGNLKSTKELNVTTEGETIVIVTTDPDVIYVPVYNPTVIYGTWPYPSYPPYYYYPPYYRPTPTLYGVGVGIAVGVAWGYAWGNCNWGGDDIDIDIDRNVNRNRDIDRNWYKKNTNMADGRGTFQHDATHRRGVGYADRATAQRYNRGPSPTAGSREAYRGRSGGASPSTRPSSGQKPSTARPSTSQRQSGGFSSYDRGSNVRQQSSRGQSSRQSYSRSHGGSRSGGSRGGGGGRR
jgi:Protein of unknown function (DUF3300)